QMWCLRWAALNNKTLGDLSIHAESRFTWRGEYLEEVDSGITALHVQYYVQGSALTSAEMETMLDQVARCCPVYATLVKSTPIVDSLHLNSSLILEKRRG